jgi:hypothetical protein
MHIREASLHSIGAGSFGSPPPDGLDGCQSVFGEVLEAFDHLEAEPSYEGERGVATSREHLRGMPGVSAGVVSSRQVTSRT